MEASRIQDQPAVVEWPDRQRQAVALRFGLAGGDGQSWDGAGERLGVSGDTPRALVGKGLARLRVTLGRPDERVSGIGAARTCQAEGVGAGPAVR